MRLEFVYKNRSIETKNVSLSINEATGEVSYSGYLPQDCVTYTKEYYVDVGEYVFFENTTAYANRDRVTDDYGDVTFADSYYLPFIGKDGARWEFEPVGWSCFSNFPFYGTNGRDNYYYQVGDSSFSTRQPSTATSATYDKVPVYRAEITAYHYSFQEITWQETYVYNGESYHLQSGQGTQNATYVKYNNIFDIIDGANFSISYNEDLGSATILIRSNNKIDIEPFDEVKILDLGFDLYMCVDTYNEVETRNRNGEKVYTYTITLMSQTKLLENYALPSLSITPVKDYKLKPFAYTLPNTINQGDVFEYDEEYEEQDYSENPSYIITADVVVDISMCFDIEWNYTNKGFHLKLTRNSTPYPISIIITKNVLITFKSKPTQKIITYLERYNDLYGPKIRTANGFVNKWSFSSECYDKFNVDCPELQFNAPTFRECLTLLMNVKDSIPILSNNVISFIDISQKQNELDKDDERIAYVETSQSSADYVSDLKMNIKNTIQDDNYITINEYISLRNPNGPNVDTNNMMVVTQHQIYDIKKVYMCLICRYTYKAHKPGITDDRARATYLEYDITNYIKEKKEWETLPIRNWFSQDDLGKYQNLTLYYERGGNVITNFANLTHQFVVFNVNVFTILAAKIMDDYVKNRLEHDLQEEGWESLESYDNLRLLKTGYDDDITYNDWNVVTFKVEYQTKADIVAKIGKDTPQTTHREVVDNQSNNYVNAFTQGLLEYAKANRLGNKMKTYHARYLSGETLPKAGDYFSDGNEIIYKVDYQFWSHCVDITMYACPNYVLRNYFTGVQSKLRAWKIVDTDEAFYREDLYKYYIEFSKQAHYGKELFFTAAFLKDCLGSLDNRILDIKMITIESFYFNDSIVNLEMEVAKNIVGNSVCYYVGFEDNFSNGKYIYSWDGKREGESVVSGSLQDYTRYVDDLTGKITNFSIKFLRSVDFYDTDFNIDGKAIYDTEGGTFGPDRVALDKLVNRGMNLPKSYHYNEIPYTILNIVYHKDNKEIPKLNFQFEYCSDTQDILVCEEFMKGQLNKINKSDLSIRIVAGNQVNSKLPIGSDISIDNLILDSSSNISAHLIINNMLSTQTAFIYNTLNNQVLLSLYGNSFYMNLLKDRDKKIYRKSGNNWIIDGEI